MKNKKVIKLLKPLVAIGIISYVVYFVISKLDIDVDIWDIFDIDEEESL
jgi:hypothetical protein